MEAAGIEPAQDFNRQPELGTLGRARATARLLAARQTGKLSEMTSLPLRAAVRAVWRRHERLWNVQELAAEPAFLVPLSVVCSTALIAV
jgi:hypothetical protein